MGDVVSMAHWEALTKALLNGTPREALEAAFRAHGDHGISARALDREVRDCWALFDQDVRTRRPHAARVGEDGHLVVTLGDGTEVQGGFLAVWDRIGVVPSGYHPNGAPKPWRVVDVGDLVGRLVRVRYADTGEVETVTVLAVHSEPTAGEPELMFEEGRE